MPEILKRKIGPFPGWMVAVAAVAGGLVFFAIRGKKTSAGKTSQLPGAYSTPYPTYNATPYVAGPAVTGQPPTGGLTGPPGLPITAKPLGPTGPPARGSGGGTTASSQGGVYSPPVDPMTSGVPKGMAGMMNPVAMMGWTSGIPPLGRGDASDGSGGDDGSGEGSDGSGGDPTGGAGASTAGTRTASRTGKARGSFARTARALSRVGRGGGDGFGAGASTTRAAAQKSGKARGNLARVTRAQAHLRG